MTPYKRYWERREELDNGQLDLTVRQYNDMKREIEEELEIAQAACSPHIDDGGMFEGCCVLCGKLLG